jgi:hypothetical protein
VRVDFQQSLEALFSSHFRHDEIEDHKVDASLLFSVDRQCLPPV